MSRFVEFPLESGGSIVIESADEPTRTPSGFLRSGEPNPDASHQAQGSFDASVEAIRQSAELLVSKLRGLSAPPDELEIQFSLKASAETASLVVGKSGSDANFGVLLRWRSDKAQGDDDDDDRSHKHGSSEGGRKDPGEHYKQRQRRTLAAGKATQAETDDDEDDDDEDRL